MLGSESCEFTRLFPLITQQSQRVIAAIILFYRWEAGSEREGICRGPAGGRRLHRLLPRPEDRRLPLEQLGRSVRQRRGLPALEQLACDAGGEPEKEQPGTKQFGEEGRGWQGQRSEVTQEKNRLDTVPGSVQKPGESRVVCCWGLPWRGVRGLRGEHESAPSEWQEGPQAAWVSLSAPWGWTQEVTGGAGDARTVWSSPSAPGLLTGAPVRGHWN